MLRNDGDAVGDEQRPGLSWLEPCLLATLEGGGNNRAGGVAVDSFDGRSRTGRATQPFRPRSRDSESSTGGLRIGEVGDSRRQGHCCSADEGGEHGLLRAGRRAPHRVGNVLGRGDNWRDEEDDDGVDPRICEHAEAAPARTSPLSQSPACPRGSTRSPRPGEPHAAPPRSPARARATPSRRLRKRRHKGSRGRRHSSGRRPAGPEEEAGSRGGLRRRSAPRACAPESPRPGGRARPLQPRSLRGRPCASSLLALRSQSFRSSSPGSASFARRDARFVRTGAGFRTTRGRARRGLCPGRPPSTRAGRSTRHRPCYRPRRRPRSRALAPRPSRAARARARRSATRTRSGRVATSAGQMSRSGSGRRPRFPDNWGRRACRRGTRTSSSR